METDATQKLELFRQAFFPLPPEVDGGPQGYQELPVPESHSVPTH
jgi:hypothetical protein